MGKDQSGFIVVPESILAGFPPRAKSLYNRESTQLLFAVRAVAQVINDQANTWLQPLGLTAGKYNYLAAIYASARGAGTPGLTPNELRKLIHSTSASVTQMLNTLVREGLVIREDHTQDKRSVVITMTSEGKRVFEAAFRVHHKNIELALEGISDKERQTLTKLLARVGGGFRSATT
jgi:DNA-binding MarR family transcriptional regulator